MPQPSHVHALSAVPVPERPEVSETTGRYWDRCVEKLGFMPNVLRAYAFDELKLQGFTGLYNEVMLGVSGLNKLEREMIAVAVSSSNRCYYCLAAHGAAVRELSGDPELGELMALNHRTADLSPRHRAMLAFAVKLAERPWEMAEADRQALRDAGFTDRDIWDIAAVASFFAMSNRMASAIDLMPNPEYHRAAR